MDTKLPPNTRGYARNERETERLRDKGVTVIYRGDQDEPFRMRRGELLAVVNLRAFGASRRAMVEAVKKVHGQGAVIIDIGSDKWMRSDQDGAEMLDRALANFVPSAEHAREMQRRSVLARTDGRMAKRDALSIWRNPRLTNLEAVDLMRGWSLRTAYSKLGPRMIPPGRRTKRETE